MICPDCEQDILLTSNGQKRCTICSEAHSKQHKKNYYLLNKEAIKIKHAEYYLAHRKEILRRTAVYQKAHQKEVNDRAVARRAEYPELSSVRNHYSCIFCLKNSRYPNYKGMPFYDGWNPKKGGSFKTAETWIIENIGKRPKGSSLHIIEHEKGFVPENIEWAYPKKQNNQQMFKIIAQQRNRIRKLEKQILEKEEKA